MSVLLSSPASAARPRPKTPVPTAYAHQVLNRMSFGFCERTFAQLERDGGGRAWFHRQLHPASIKDPRGHEVDAWWPDRMVSANQKWKNVFADRKSAWEYAVDLANWTLMRRTQSSRQLLEVMTDFWSNHFHIPATHDLAWCYRNHYDATIRTRALGRFDDLLVAVSLHPSMRLFLNNFESTRDVPNENQGRELLELHSVGREAGYTEQMVKDSARILSGYTVAVWDDWHAYYDPARHATGQVRVLGFRHGNGHSDGRAVTEKYLRYLAHHPSTARNIATKLALRFVSDKPSAQLVNYLAQRFRASGTDVSATLQALIEHPDFAASRGGKVRNPIEDFLATVRVLGVTAHKPTRSESQFARSQIWMCQGQYPFQWPRPDGMPQHSAAWASASSVLNSFDTHYSLSGGWIGEKGSVTYRTRRSWLPEKALRFDHFVDHLCRVLLGRPSNDRLQHAARQATGCRSAEIVDADHQLVSWMMPRLLTAILDTPEHMS
ncbi:MAG TPA: DUF1800 domain-containing protein, partial [Nocardioidaceae bacterium]